MDYFSLSKVKQNRFKQKQRRRQSSVIKFLFFVDVQAFGAATGGTDPALAGGYVLPVLGFNTDEEKLVTRRAQCQTAVHVHKGIG